MEQDSFQWGFGPPLECVTCGAGRIVIQCSLTLPTGCTGSVAKWEVRGQLPPVPCLGPLSMSYSTICRWMLLVLCSEVLSRVQNVNQGQLLLVLGLGPLSKRYGVHRGQMLLV